MRVVIFILTATVSAVAGCSSATDPAADAEVEFTFGIQRLAIEPAFMVESIGGDVVVRGTYEALTSGYTAEASADLSAGTIELRVVGTQPDNNHPVVVATGYEATVRGVSPGRTHIRVIHEYRGVNRPPAVVFEQALPVQ